MTDPGSGPRTEAAPSAVPPPTGRWCLGTRLLVGATVGWIAFLTAHVLLSGRWWPWLVPEALPPLTLLLVPLLLLALVPLARPVRRRLAPVLVLALLAGIPLAGLTGGALPTGQVSPGDLKVFVWNTYYWGTDDDPDDFYAYLRSQRADVYLLQEYLHWQADGPVRIDDTERLRREFPGYRLVVEGELITLTRMPVVATHARPTGGSGTDWYTRGKKAQRTDIAYGGQTLSLYNVHMQVPYRADRTPFSADFHRFMRDQHALRRAELEALRADLAANPHPALVAGDFNTPWVHGVVRLGPGLHRQDPDTGLAPPLTWPVAKYGLPRVWRLDWVFTTADVSVTSHRLVGAEGLSDHLAMELRISVEP
ncbi:endonuclease/exonuclease/phosphatase family protein [Streptomyces sp. ACA25]|uniref:endonuclease/exonuclease/phosphatase family protein n=1 Tax=Streptomyces sp. ACA25 TaxID=3022596 RepID=UPI002308087C|nr:endonuclease/exonuclease/phosphatase family protein [Streptomyces sp. ACA25]MDB1087434.1 endonuclease/exonuclease/phosphatase family protein [Streptomyces sp. ACA25]